jgi:hypothetical protein
MSLSCICLKKPAKSPSGLKAVVPMVGSQDNSVTMLLCSYMSACQMDFHVPKTVVYHRKWEDIAGHAFVAVYQVVK